MKMSHLAAGGVTLSRFDVGVRGIETWDIPKCVEHRLGAILSHKEVPQWSPPEGPKGVAFFYRETNKQKTKNLFQRCCIPV